MKLIKMRPQIPHALTVNGRAYITVWLKSIILKTHCQVWETKQVSYPSNTF